MGEEEEEMREEMREGGDRRRGKRGEGCVRGRGRREGEGE